MAVCSGAMVVSHVNDSFFWVITQMTGMSVRQGYRFHTLGTLLCGTCRYACGMVDLQYSSIIFYGNETEQTNFT